VLNYRRFVLEDATRFDACSIYRHLGSPDDYPARIPEHLHPVLDNLAARPCEAPAPDSLAAPTRYIGVAAVTYGDSTAEIRLDVRKGEWSHQETFYLRQVRGTDRWSVREVRLSPGIQAYPGRPRSAPTP
jgi:hypothetical protein